MATRYKSVRITETVFSSFSLLYDYFGFHCNLLRNLTLLLRCCCPPCAPSLLSLRPPRLES